MKIPVIYRKKGSRHFLYIEITEKKLKRGYSEEWEVIRVKNWIDGLIQSNRILERENKEKQENGKED